jgi:DNA-binding protein YbaB
MTAQAEAIREYLVRLQTDAHDRAARGQQLARETAALSVDGRDAGRTVTAIVDSTGNLVDLRITDAAMRLSAEQLSRRVLDASANARGRLTAAVTGLARDVLGADSPGAQLLERSYT